MDKNLEYEGTGGRALDTDLQQAPLRSGSGQAVQGDIQAGPIQGEGTTLTGRAGGGGAANKPVGIEPQGNWQGQDVGGGFEGDVKGAHGVGDDYPKTDFPDMGGESRT